MTQKSFELGLVLLVKYSLGTAMQQILNGWVLKLKKMECIKKILKFVDFNYSPTSEANRGVYWNQAHKNFTHPYTGYPWVSVTL